MDVFKAPRFRSAMEERGIRVLQGKRPLPYTKEQVPMWIHPQGAQEGKANYNRKTGLWMKASIMDTEELIVGNQIKLLHTRPLKHGLESTSVDEKSGGAVLVKESAHSPNDAAVVLVEACGLYRFIVSNQQRGDAAEQARIMYQRMYGGNLQRSA